MKAQGNHVWINATLVTLEGEGYGLIEEGALVVEEGKIAWLGVARDLPAHYAHYPKEDAKGYCLTPGLIDCHTHVVYAGDRVDEYEARLNGKTYAEIALSGGGIQKTVRATREASEETLYCQSEARVQSMLNGGVTTLEIKSGYGLDLQTELKQLRVARRLANNLPVRIQTTFLGAHTVPPEYRGRADAYIDLVCHEMIPRIAKENMAQAVDAFCENIAFSVEQVERVFETAHAHHLRVKLHAEQLSSLGAARLAARYRALSVDHLEYLPEADVPLLAEAGTVAVLLPGAYYFLKETQKPPVHRLREHQVPMAIATDCNPGSSPTTSLTLMMSMACQFFGLTPLEAWKGVTIEAAKALGLNEEIGSLVVGKRADLALWRMYHPATLVYEFGEHRCIKTQLK